MVYIPEHRLDNSNIAKSERKEIKDMAKEAFKFVEKGGDPRDLPKHLRTE